VLLRNVSVYLPVHQDSNLQQCRCGILLSHIMLFVEDGSDPYTTITFLAIRTHGHISDRLPVPDQNLGGVSLFNVDFNVVTVVLLHVLRQLSPSAGQCYCTLQWKVCFASRSVIFLMLIIDTKICSVCIVMFHDIVLFFMYLCLLIVISCIFSYFPVLSYLVIRLLSEHINPLKTKRKLLYLKTQSVPRCKHFSSRL